MAFYEELKLMWEKLLVAQNKRVKYKKINISHDISSRNVAYLLQLNYG
jgi:hypothetical protein